MAWEASPQPGGYRRPGLQPRLEPAGQPCVNVPGLFGPHRMPIGLQLVGHPQRERELLAVAKRVGELLAA
jgi:Asp-tRNA(Asn)/Glu-tRNA(Gln) amidotransferase A subunit family amidase